MAGESPELRKAQLDKEEREHLEDVVTEMRDRVEANVRYQLEASDLDEAPDENATLSDDEKALVEAIELGAVDSDDWADGYEQYVTGVGYTIVNRLAALRCMEVRGFVDDEVTRFREDGLTPAADQLVTEEFMLEAEAVLEAYRNACDSLAEEIEILFDRSTAYSLLDPDDDTFEDLCGMLDEVPDEVWRADDVLGWVYEYYNVKLLDDLRRKGDRVGLDPEDVPPANQFYTPHWVVRMLTDNSLGKLYLESTGELADAVETQETLDPDERKHRPLSPDETPTIADFCTYLVPSEEAGEPTDFDGPEDLRVIDPACGSGHFLLYAFDVLERIWRAERPDLAPAEIPWQILQHNLYGVDLDMRACQLAAFNLYLKGRTRAEAEGAEGFEMPQVGIVCADAKVADVEGVEEVFEEVADGRPEVEDALRRILDAFEEIHGLGSLLDVRGTLGDLFEDDSDAAGVQITLGDDPREEHTLGEILGSLREAVEEQRNGDSFLAQDLRSFVRLLDVLARDFDVALMNPPYGSKNRMPDVVQEYVEKHYRYSSEFYINFFEVCDQLSKENGRVGMLVPRTFMFKDRYADFRTDFIGDQGNFDFLAEYGIGVLDNATVRTVGTVVRSGVNQTSTGSFLRLHDIERKESRFLEIICGEDSTVRRFFEIDLSEFETIPRNPICYSTPQAIRNLHNSDIKIDAERAGVNAESVCDALQGLATANDDRFARYHWEVEDFELFKPISKGGADAWIMPHVVETVEWGEAGVTLKRSSKEVRTRNEEYYGQGGLTWTYIKDTGRRFGYYPPDGLFSHAGFMLIPKSKEKSLWVMMAILNSSTYHTLFLSQTTDRHWNAGEVGSLPWLEKLEDESQLEELAKEQYQIMLHERIYKPSSPYYVGPNLLPSGKTEFFYDHLFADKVNLSNEKQLNSRTDAPLAKVAKEERKRELENKNRLESIFDKIDSIIFDSLEIGEDTQKELSDEIFLRTAEDPEDRQIPDPESVPEVPVNIDQQVKDLIHHFAMEAVREEADGIIPLEGIDGQPSVLDRIVERFEDVYGEYAADRLVEVDEILGAETAAEEEYPNLRRFIENDLFAYHVERMENTPIVWKLTTEQLLADPEGEGFACFLDYHGLDASLFDRLSTQYLEPRKAELRERRSAANQRRNDDSLSTSDRAEATEEFEFCSSALEQIAEFEEVLGDLGSTDPREFDAEDRERVRALAPKVAAFREETARRIDTLEALLDENGEEWFEDTFSNKFWETVDDWRDEWLDALTELERACEEYAKPGDEPVEAHLADLFDYFNWRLKGSSHYSSSGILFMTYYFEREGADLLDEDGEPYDGLADDEQLLASLATGLDDPTVLDEDVEDVERPPLEEYRQLAEEIDDLCGTIHGRIPTDWTDRALSEITTAGYQPNHKHGVAINITPLAERKVVPDIVEEKVI